MVRWNVQLSSLSKLILSDPSVTPEITWAEHSLLKWVLTIDVSRLEDMLLYIDGPGWFEPPLDRLWCCLLCFRRFQKMNLATCRSRTCLEISTRPWNSSRSKESWVKGYEKTDESMNLVLQGVHQLALIHRASVDNIQSFLLARRAAVNVASCDALVVPLHLEGVPAHPSPKLSFWSPVLDCIG